VKFARSLHTTVSAKLLIEFWFVMQWVFSLAIPGSQHDATCVPACSSQIKNTQHVSNALRHRRRKIRHVGYKGHKTAWLE